MSSEPITADDRLLDPKNTPNGLDPEKGIKRLNKVPLMIVGGFIVIVLVMFLYIVMARAAKSKVDPNAPAPTQEAKKSPQQDQVIKSVEKMLASAPEGTIPAESPALELPKPVTDGSGSTPGVVDNVAALPHTVPNYQGQPMQQGQLTPIPGNGRLAPPQGGSGGSGLSEERKKARQKVGQFTENAIYAGTAIPINNKGSAQPQRTPTGGAGSSNNIAGFGGDTDLMELQNQRENLMAKRDQMIKEYGIDGRGGAGLQAASNANGLNGISTNLTQVPKVQAGGSGGAGSTPNWHLNSERMAGERYAVKTGAIIPAIMIGGINSDLQGSVIAQVSQDVKDTASGEHTIIPQGSRLFGSYNHDVILGQERVVTRWDRIVFPDSSTIDLAGMAGADQMGYSGFKDLVNNHYWRIFGNAFLLSLISAGYQSAMPDRQSNGNGQRSVSEELSLSMAQQFNETGREMIRKNMQIKPTIEIRPGYRFTIMVNKDMLFTAPYSPMELTDNQ